MNSRERLLIIGVVAVVVLFGLKLGYDQVSGMFDDRDRLLSQANTRIDKAQADVRAGNVAAKKISDWEKRSLPSDRQLAQVLYQSWLVNLVSKYDFGAKDVHPLNTLSRTSMTDKQGFEKFGFEVKGVSDITTKQLVDFMYEFYASNQLHKIRMLDVRPLVDGKHLDVRIQIEAMLLPGAKSTDGKPRHDKLADVGLKSLSLGNMSAYEKLITGRNLLAEYTPPTPPRNDRSVSIKGERFDVAKYTTLTGIVTENDDPRIFVSVKPTGEKFNGLKEGDEFTVGGVTYKVVSIGARDAVLLSEGKRKQVDLGGNLHDAVELPDDGKL